MWNIQNSQLSLWHVWSTLIFFTHFKISLLRTLETSGIAAVRTANLANLHMQFTSLHFIIHIQSTKGTTWDQGILNLSIVIYNTHLLRLKHNHIIQKGLILRRGYILEYLVVNRIVVKDYYLNGLNWDRFMGQTNWSNNFIIYNIS